MKSPRKIRNDQKETKYEYTMNINDSNFFINENQTIYSSNNSIDFKFNSKRVKVTSSTNNSETNSKQFNHSQIEENSQPSEYISDYINTDFLCFRWNS